MGISQASQLALVEKDLPANVGDVKRCSFDPWVGKIPWNRAWKSTPVFLTGESHGQKGLGATVHRVAQSDMTEAT